MTAFTSVKTNRKSGFSVMTDSAEFTIAYLTHINIVCAALHFEYFVMTDKTFKMEAVFPVWKYRMGHKRGRVGAFSWNSDIPDLIR